MFLKITLDIGQFLIKIWDAAAGELKHLGRPKPCIEELKKARAGLEAKAADIDNSINQAPREGQIPSNQIEQWITEVKELKDKAIETEQDFERRRCLAGWSWNCFSVNRRVAKRMDEIDKLMKRVDATPVASIPTPPAVVQIPTSNSTIAMESYMSEILGHIDSTNVGAIGVYGMGGVGKTTLLKRVNNHRDVAKFDQVIWAVASKECNIERLQMDIAKRLKLHLEKDDSEEDRAARLFHFLMNKDCLLLLDDVWAYLNLEKLGMAHATQGEQKRKVVVFTTRHKEVCGRMKVSKMMEIKCLGPEHAWELFLRNAGEDAIRSDAGINRIAHLIVEECAGLPLALVTVGMAMSTKQSWEAWNDALTQLKCSQMPKVTGMENADSMFFAFKLSYDTLEDDDTRGCLLSCALWPEDYSIKKVNLIECWMGLGLIDEVGAIYKAYNRGYSHIETLRAACLLEPGNKETEVKMHDVIRDMAMWIASDCGMNKFKWIVKAGGAASQGFEQGAWHKAERVSLLCNDFESLPNQLSTCSKLSVLMLQWNNKLKEIHGSLVMAMPALTYLDLEYSEITNIPKEIGMLSQLQYLNLSFTPIEELPAELGCLDKLNYLILRYTVYLTVVAKGAISKLSSLRLLDLRRSKYEDWWDELKNLEGYQKSIGIDITLEANLELLCTLAHLSTWRLNVIGFWDSANLNQLLDDIMRRRNIWQNLEQLTIQMVEMGNLLIREGNEEGGGFECLKHLELIDLDLLEEIMWDGVQPQIIFPNLRELTIDNCKRLRNVNWALQMPSLSFLKIANCEAMEELISDDGNSSFLSFGLRRMRLFEMPKLRSISLRPLDFPYLEEIKVRSCPLLRKLPFDNRISKNRLKVIECNQTWWDNLEWDDVRIKDLLSPLMQRK